jgi:hypothetical protein
MALASAVRRRVNPAADLNGDGELGQVVCSGSNSPSRGVSLSRFTPRAAISSDPPTVRVALEST